VEKADDDEWVCTSGLDHRILREPSGVLPLDLLGPGVYWPLDEEQLATPCPECPNLCIFKPQMDRAGKPFPHGIEILDPQTGAERQCNGSILDPGRMPQRCPSPLCRGPFEDPEAQQRCLYCGSAVIRCARCRAVNLPAARFCRRCGAEIPAFERAAVGAAPWASLVGRPVAFQWALLDGAASAPLGDVRCRWGMAHHDAAVFVLQSDSSARTWVVSARRGSRTGERTWVGKATLLRPEAGFVVGVVCGTVGILVTSRGLCVQSLEDPDLPDPAPVELDLLRGIEWRGADLAVRDEATFHLALRGVDPSAGDREHLWCILLDRWGEPLKRSAVKRSLRPGSVWGPVWLTDGRLWVARQQGDELVAETLRPFEEGEWRPHEKPGISIAGRKLVGPPRVYEESVILGWNAADGRSGGIMAWRADAGWAGGESAAWKWVSEESPVQEASLGGIRFLYRGVSEESTRLPLVAWEVRGGRIERAFVMDLLERVECVHPAGAPWMGKSYWAWLENPSGDGLDVRIARTNGKTLDTSLKIGERVQGMPLGACAESRDAHFSLIRRGERIDIAEVRWGHERFVRSRNAT